MMLLLLFTSVVLLWCIHFEVSEVFGVPLAAVIFHWYMILDCVCGGEIKQRCYDNIKNDRNQK